MVAQSILFLLFLVFFIREFCLMKEVLSALTRDEYSTADTVNAEGAKAWKASIGSRLKQLCMTGTMGNSFYAKTKQTVDEAMKVLKEAHAAELCSAIITGRTEGFIRTFNIIGLVYLSMKDIGLFRSVFSTVIRTGNDMGDFIDMMRRTRGFGRGIKSTIHAWLKEKATPFYAMKYRKQLADAIRISRFKGEESIYKYILHHYDKGLSISGAYEKYPELKALAECQEIARKGEDWPRALELLKKYRLDPMSIIGAGKLPPEVWDELADMMGVMMFLKYLNKLTEVGTFQRHRGLLAKKITAGNLAKAKVFPFRLYIAYINVTDRMVKEHLANTLEAYSKVFDWGAFNKFSWVIAPDVSGSMTWSDVNITPAVVAGMFSGFLYKGLDNALVLPWDTQVYPDKMGPRMDSVITHINKIANANGGGTHMESPVKYMLDNDIDVDIFMLITDAEEWGEGWLNSWVKYKKKHPNARAVMMRVDTNNTQAFSDEKAEKLGIIQLFGYNDNALKFIETHLRMWA